MLIALLLNLLGFALLALSQPRNLEQVLKENITIAPVATTQRAISFIAIGMSLVVCCVSQGASFGSLLWVLELAAAAMAVALTLTWRAHWLRGFARLLRLVQHHLER